MYVAGYTYDLTPRGPTAVQPTNARQTLFRTKDGGAHWSPPGPGLEATVIYAMAIDPQDGSIVYASGFGALGGLFRSTDRGDSWTALFTDLPVGKIIVDPRDSKHLVIFAGGLATEEYVSRDSGATWKHRGPVSARFSDLVNNMVFDPSRPQNAYATGLGGPFYSRDGGDTWVESMVYKPAFAPNPERWTLPIVDSSNPDTLYVSAVSNSLGVYRSTDAGLTNAERKSLRESGSPNSGG